MMDSGAQQDRVPTARSLEIPKRWPLVTNLGSRNQLFNKDARLINAYAEKDRSTGEYQVEKRPGFALTPAIAGQGKGQGIICYPYLNAVSPPALGISYVVIWINNVTVYGQLYYADGTTGLVINLGRALPSQGAIQPLNKAQFLLVPVPGGLPVVVVSLGFGSSSALIPNLSSLNWYTSPVGQDPIAGFPGLVSGVNNFPSYPVPGFIYLDGYVYVMDINGTIWQTQTQNQVVNWNPTGFITANAESDLGVQLARQLIYVIAIKQWSTQVFYDAGNATGSSLSPVPGAMYNKGCLSPDTFAQLDEILFWVTQSKEGTYEVIKLDNLEMKTISTPAVERQLDLGPGGSWYSMAYHHAGHKWYVLTNVNTNITMAFDIGENLWYLWTDYQGNYYPVAARTSSPTGQEWHQMISTGNVYQMDGDYVYPTDHGLVVPVDIYTPNFDAGVDRIKYLSQMRFNADQTAGSTLFVSSSDNDYGSFSRTARRVDLGRQRPILNDEGSFYRRAYHFRHYANTGLRIRSVDLQMDIGTL